MQRHFAEVEGRRLHYRRAGSGPPVVMLHGSPGNSEMLEHEMAAAASRFTVFALDTPGFGMSDPLPGATLEVADLARATAAGMAAIGLPPCPVYGTHTGALIALELGAGWPERTTGLVLEGVPIFTDAEIAALFEGYFEPLLVDPLGGHLTSTWMRFRDQHTWFPWLSRDVNRLNPVDRPTPEEIHHWVMMFYRSCRTYSAAYKAACYHGHRAHEAAERLHVPAVYMASAEDMLFPHLDRLPAMKPGQRIERLAYDPAAKFAAIADFLGSVPPATGAAPDLSPTPVGHDPAVQFFAVDGGSLFARCYGDPAAAPFILLHDAPGSGLSLQPLARTLAESRYVVVPDLPGCGESGVGEGDILEAGAHAVSEIADALGIDRFTLAAVGCSCAVAAKLGGEPGIERMILASPPRPDAATAASIAPDLPLTPEGSHWIKAWLMVRDGQIYDPWFDGRVAAQRRTQGNFDGEWLHQQTFEIMKARTTYHRLPRAAFAFDSHAALRDCAVPVTITDGPLAAALATPDPAKDPSLTMLDLACAERVAKAAIAHARSVGGKPSGVVVIDASTSVKFALREDGANLAAVDIATGKARAALTFSCTSKQIADGLSGNPLAGQSVLSVLGGRIVLLGGAVPIKAADGTIVGAIGVAGGPPDEDEAIAAAGAAAL